MNNKLFFCNSFFEDFSTIITLSILYGSLIMTGSFITLLTSDLPIMSSSLPSSNSVQLTF